MKMTRLIPMLPVRSMPASVEFYQKLGFEVERRNDGWRWAMLVFGECRLMVDESINLHPGAPRHGVLYLYPDDIVEGRVCSRQCCLQILQHLFSLSGNVTHTDDFTGFIF